MLIPVSIELRGRKFSSDMTDDDALFLESLIMTPEELRVLTQDCDPVRADEMLRDRMKRSHDAIRSQLEGQSLSQPEMEKLIGEDAIQKIILPLVVRVNQDFDSIRARLARRLKGIFPSLPDAWVSRDDFRLTVREIGVSVIVPLFYYFSEYQKSVKAEETAIAAAPNEKQDDRPLTTFQSRRRPARGFAKLPALSTPTIPQKGVEVSGLAFAAEEIDPPEAIAPDAAPDDPSVEAVLSAVRGALDKLPADVRSRLLSEVAQEPV